MFDEVMKRVDTPAKHDLFNVESEIVMSKERLEIFHHIVETLSYMSKMVRVNIYLAVSFLCTRVSRDTEEDWDKMMRLFNYLSGTIYMPRIICTNGMAMTKTYLDALYAVHQDMKGHT